MEEAKFDEEESGMREDWRMEAEFEEINGEEVRVQDKTGKSTRRKRSLNGGWQGKKKQKKRYLPIQRVVSVFACDCV